MCVRLGIFCQFIPHLKAMCHLCHCGSSLLPAEISCYYDDYSGIVQQKYLDKGFPPKLLF